MRIRDQSDYTWFRDQFRNLRSSPVSYNDPFVVLLLRLCKFKRYHPYFGKVGALNSVYEPCLSVSRGQSVSVLVRLWSGLLLNISSPTGQITMKHGMDISLGSALLVTRLVIGGFLGNKFL